MSDANWMQEAVTEFMRKHGHPTPERYTQLSGERAALRIRLIQEELEELRAAMGLNAFGAKVAEEDEEAVIDAVCDLLYVVIGTAVEMGLPLQRFFAEVHRSNMTKEPGEKRDDGKILKGPEFEEPRIAELFERLKRRQAAGAEWRRVEADPPAQHCPVLVYDGAEVFVASLDPLDDDDGDTGTWWWRMPGNAYLVEKGVDVWMPLPEVPAGKDR